MAKAEIRISSNDDMKLNFTTYKIEGTPKKLNVRWTRSKWTIFQMNIPECEGIWYTHESDIRLPYPRNRILNWLMLHVIGRIVCFFKGVEYDS
jgi:hypothetical protein